jgi:hypothetical protein
MRVISDPTSSHDKLKLPFTSVYHLNNKPEFNSRISNLGYPTELFFNLEKYSNN